MLILLFITDFYNLHLLLQCSHSSSTSKETPSKRILQPQIIKTSDPVKNNIESPKISNISENVTKTPVRFNVSDAEKRIGAHSNLLNIPSSSPIPNPQSSTPIITKKNSSSRKRVELISCNSSQGRNINPAFKESFECEQVSNLTDSKNISFDNSSFPSLGGNNSTSLDANNVSTNSRNVNTSASSELFNSYLSQKSSFSMSNRVLQSPVSPLYTNPVSMLSPINQKISQSRYNDNQSNNSYFQQNNTSTPERTPNSDFKNSRTPNSDFKNSKTPNSDFKNSRTPRQNFNLSDFIVMDVKSSKKRSGKKNNSKTSQKDVDQQSVSSDISDITTNSEQSARRRKVNPTRLNDTDEKGNIL